MVKVHSLNITMYQIHKHTACLVIYLTEKWLLKKLRKCALKSQHSYCLH